MRRSLTVYSTVKIFLAGILMDFLSELKKSSNNENILVVAHNGISRLFIAHKLGMNLKDYRRIVQENSSITPFTIDENDDIFLRLLNSKGV